MRGLVDFIAVFHIVALSHATKGHTYFNLIPVTFANCGHDTQEQDLRFWRSWLLQQGEQSGDEVG